MVSTLLNSKFAFLTATPELIMVVRVHECVFHFATELGTDDGEVPDDEEG
jgi:hypothetical protein